MIKVIGSVLIIFATTLYGVRRASKLSKRHKTLEKTGLCLQVMENEISYTNCCIDDVLNSVSQICEFDGIFNTCAKMKGFVRERWRRSVVEDKVRLCLNNSDCEILLMLSESLGMVSREEQIKSIIHVRNLIEQSQKEAWEEYMREGKLLRGLGVGAGLFIIILLI
ncbi:MAG: stage III sporulation protein AB [Clostridia bacterium]|nr:stage III sporulation protein AB [Clostridia bacterium]